MSTEVWELYEMSALASTEVAVDEEVDEDWLASNEVEDPENELELEPPEIEPLAEAPPAEALPPEIEAEPPEIEVELPEASIEAPSTWARARTRCITSGLLRTS